MTEALSFENGALVRYAGPVVEALTPTPLLAAALAEPRGPDFLDSLWRSMAVVDELVADRAVHIRTLH